MWGSRCFRALKRRSIVLSPRCQCSWGGIACSITCSSESRDIKFCVDTVLHAGVLTSSATNGHGRGVCGQRKDAVEGHKNIFKAQMLRQQSGHVPADDGKGIYVDSQDGNQGPSY